VGLAGLYKLCMSGVKLWKEVPTWDLKWLKGASLGIDATPALLGVGYIIGPRIASLMMAGAALGYLAIAPLLAFVGTSAPDLVLPPATEALSALDPAGIRNNYIKYIGAGAVAFGGLVSLVKAIPVIVTSFGLGIREVAGSAGPRTGNVRARSGTSRWWWSSWGRPSSRSASGSTPTAT